MVSLRAAFFSARVKIRVNSSGRPRGNTWLEIRSLERGQGEGTPRYVADERRRNCVRGSLQWNSTNFVKCHPVAVKTVWYPLLRGRKFEKVWENDALSALWIANYNIKPFVRNLSIEFYFKWMLRMTPLHSTLRIPSFSCLQIQDVWKGDRFWRSSPYYNTLLIIVSRGE